MADIFLERIATFAEKALGNNELKHRHLRLLLRTICQDLGLACDGNLDHEAVDGDVVRATTPVNLAVALFRLARRLRSALISTGGFSSEDQARHQRKQPAQESQCRSLGSFLTVRRRGACCLPHSMASKSADD